MIEGAQALLNLPGRANPIFLEGKLLPLRAETAQALNLRDGQIVQANLLQRGDQPWLLLRGQALPLPPGSPRLQQVQGVGRGGGAEEKLVQARDQRLGGVAR
ncbi:MAG: hypothetical protein ACKOFG_02390, partial [Limnohabitans sp.]